MAFNATLELKGKTAIITLSGSLDASTAPAFKEKVESLIGWEIERLVLKMADLEYMASAGLRVLIFTKQKMGAGADIYIVSPQEMVLDTIEKTGFHHSVYVVDQYEAAIA